MHEALPKRTGFDLIEAVKVRLIMIALCVFAAGVGACWFLLLPKLLPSPTGPFAVGVTGWSRAAAGLQSSQACPLATRLWYPAEQRRWTWYDRSARLLSIRRWVTIPASQEAPPASSPQRFPVIVFFPGWSGGLNDNTALVADLASRGFVVLALGYESGECAGLSGQERAKLDLSSEAGFARTQVAAHMRFVRVIRAAQQALDDLAALDRSDPSGRFVGRLDLSRLAAVGHSFGGALSVELCARDARPSAAVNIDGWLFEAGADVWMKQPLLFLGDGGAPASREALQSQDPIQRNMARLEFADEQRVKAAISAGLALEIILEGTRHEYFSDFPYLGRGALLRFGRVGDRAVGRAADYITAFLAELWSSGMPSQMAEPNRGVSLRQPPPTAQRAPTGRNEP